MLRRFTLNLPQLLVDMLRRAAYVPQESESSRKAYRGPISPSKEPYNYLPILQGPNS